MNSIIDFESFLYYLLVLILSVYFAWKYEETNKKFFLYLSFAINCFFACIRLCVGNDYVSYATEFIEFSKDPNIDYRYEPAHFLLTYLFQWDLSGYIYVVGIEYIIAYAILYKAFVEEKILSIGIFVSITLGFQILCFDGIRQGISLAIFFYSIKYVKSGDYKRYLLCIVGGAFFHYSILLTLPAYIVRYFRFNKYLGIFLILSSYFMLLTNRVQFFDEYLYGVLDNLGYRALRFFEREEFAGGLGVLFKNIVGVLACLNIKNNSQNKEYFNLVIIGCIINNLVNGLFSLVRFADYGYYVIIFVLPYIIKQEKKYIIKLAYNSLFLGYFVFLILLGKNQHGATPYQTFFGKDTEHPERYVPLRRSDL